MNKPFTIYRSSAGSGKTRTLAKAWLKLALQFRVDYFKHVLAVTFTNKAAQEMKDRILFYLDNFSKGEDDPLAQELKKELRMDDQTFRNNSEAVRSALLHQYDDFAVSTIDAFFQKVIRAFTREAGLTGDYRLEVDQDIILEEVIDNLIDELGQDKELTDWVVEFARDNLENERAWDVRYSLIDFASEIFREEFRNIEDEVNAVTADKRYFRELRETLSSLKSEFQNRVQKPAREALEIIREKGWEVSDFSYGSTSGLFTFFEQFATKRPLSRYDPPKDRIRNHFTVAEKWPHKKTPHAAEIIQVAESELIPRIQQILDTYDQDYQRAFSAEVALRNLYVFGLISDISRKLKEYKDENNLMLLADAPKFLQGVISDSDTPFIYEKVGSFYRNYLIDEFQDTSGLQWKNFLPLIENSLDQGYPSLVVGDVKQAIYRWRGGDLGLLQEKLVQHIGEERVDVQELGSNFRSGKRIVNFNNALFGTASQQLAQSTGTALPALAYEDARQKVSQEDDGFVEIRFFDDPAPESGLTWRDSALEYLPRILENLQEKGASLSQIAILVRKNEEGQRIVSHLLDYKNSSSARPDCSYDVVSNESLRIDGAASVNLLLAALRYLINADDAIARAQLGYEYARLHEPTRDLVEVFAVSNQMNFENGLPQRFTRQKAALRKLPLIELTESLIDIFGLGTVKGELVYLQAFQNLVLEFSDRERNDAGAFLEWWEVNRTKKSIQISGEVNAVQILTIHKSKGLQFPYVIIPLAMWSMDHENWQSPNLWVKSDEPPFRDAGYLPVKYGKNLENSVFSSYYAEERTRTYLDNLNLMYVAFTRAEKGLVVLAPSADVRGTKSTSAGLLYESLMREPTFENGWSADKRVWTSGTLQVFPSRVSEGPEAAGLNRYYASSWRSQLVIRSTGGRWFDDVDSRNDKINYGIYIHTVLSRMRYSDELEETLDSMQLEGLTTISDREPLLKLVNELLSNSRVAEWFSRVWEVRTEVPIILPGGEELRIDRLMTKERTAVIVDFKTGTPKKRDETQVLEYIDVLRQMNYTEVEGFLLYLADNAMVEVKPSRSRLVQKSKNKDQLELGFD